MNATMKVNRKSLRDKLEGKIAERREEFANSEQVTELQEAISLLENGESQDSYQDRMAAWHQSIVDGLTDRTIGVTQTGKLKDAPPRPQKDKVLLRWSAWSLENLVERQKELERYLERELQGLYTAIELLDMTSDEEIVIESSDYQALLSSRSKW